MKRINRDREICEAVRWQHPEDQIILRGCTWPSLTRLQVIPIVMNTKESYHKKIQTSSIWIATSFRGQVATGKMPGCLHSSRFAWMAWRAESSGHRRPQSTRHLLWSFAAIWWSRPSNILSRYLGRQSWIGTGRMVWIHRHIEWPSMEETIFRTARGLVANDWRVESNLSKRLTTRSWIIQVRQTIKLEREIHKSFHKANKI